MPKFIPYDYNQNTMIVINFQDQLQPGTFEYALYSLVENNLDLSVYRIKRVNQKIGFQQVNLHTSQ